MLKIRTVTGLTDLYVLFYGSGIAVPAVEGTGNDATWYSVSDASLISAELPAGFHSGVFLQGDYTAPDIADDDTNGGVFTGFNWDGTAEVEDLGIGAAGAGLTALGDTRLANLDAAISTRMATFTYTAPDNSTIGTINSLLQDDTNGVAAIRTVADTIQEVTDQFVFTTPNVVDASVSDTLTQEDIDAIAEGVISGLVLGGSGGGTLNARIAYSSLAPNQYLQLIQGEEKILTFIVEADGRFDNQSANAISVKLADPEGNIVTVENVDVDRITEELDVQVFRVTLSAVDTATLSEGLLRIEIAFDTQKAVLTHTVKVVGAL